MPELAQFGPGYPLAIVHFGMEFHFLFRKASKPMVMESLDDLFRGYDLTFPMFVLPPEISFTSARRAVHEPLQALLMRRVNECVFDRNLLMGNRRVQSRLQH